MHDQPTILMILGKKWENLSIFCYFWRNKGVGWRYIGEIDMCENPFASSLLQPR